MLDQGYCHYASPNWVQSQFLADTRASKFKGNTETITWYVFCWWISNSAGQKYFNFEHWTYKN